MKPWALAPWIGGALIVLAAFLILPGYCADPDPVVARADTVMVVQRVRDAAQDSTVAALRDSLATLNARVATSRTREAVQREVARRDSARAAMLADSARALGEVAAAVPAWRDAYAAKSAEAAAERARADTAIAQREMAVTLANAYRDAADTLRTSRDTWQGVAEDLREAVDRAGKRRGWSLGVGLGYGVTWDRETKTLHDGPTASVTVSRPIF